MGSIISIIDYGMGNLRSVQKAFEKTGYEARIIRTPQEVRDARALVLPGVGAFRDCLKNLDALNLIHASGQIHSGRKAVPGALPGPADSFFRKRGIRHHPRP